MPSQQTEPRFPNANEPGGLARDAKALFEEVESWQATNLGRAQLQQTLPQVILELEQTRGTDAALKQNLRAYCYQELAKSHYKDDYANPLQGHRSALAELEKSGLRDPNLTDQRTLCLGGAVHKYLYFQEAREIDLERAQGYYRAAHGLQRVGELARTRELGIENCGYPGINAAYLLDVRADRVLRLSLSASANAEAKRLRQEAEALRQEVLSMLKANGIGQSAEPDVNELWDYAVYAEVHVGCGEWSSAKRWLVRFRQVASAEWEKRTCARQLVHVARMRGDSLESGSDALEILSQLFDAADPEHGAKLARCVLLGKVGLALSGGGHRAALYHIGVLARLADVGALRDVETISTVSGGSIVGVVYYLKLKHLLESKTDDAITDDDYRRIVREVREDYVRAVQKNIRLQSFASLWHNTLMLLGQKSHSERLGELYAEHFFGGTGQTMHSLLITPADAEKHDGAYNPKDFNWRRAAKVPVLMINATCLNTGHNWHFTATWMGEPPQLRGFEVDKNERLRRAYYREELSARKKLEPSGAFNERGWPAPALGAAVAASAGVPGLFPPMPIHGMYAGRVVRLVDGGSHDNQGVQALLADGCERLLCSDASGQMHERADPGEGLLGVLLRTSNILMDRVRGAQLQDIQGRVHSDVLALMFVHLRQGLPAREIPWTTSNDEMPAVSRGCTDYGVDRGTQWRLANLRTDLDAFTELEADALMCSGYLATRQRLNELDRTQRANGHRGSYGDYQIDAGGGWPFLALRDVLALPSQGREFEALEPAQRLRAQSLTKLLEVGAQMFGKLWRLSTPLKGTTVGFVVALLGATAWWLHGHWGDPIQYAAILPSDIGASAVVLAALAVVAIAPAARYAIAPERAARRWFTRIAVATVGWALASLYLLLLNPMFLKRGSRKAGAKALFVGSTNIPGPAAPQSSVPPNSSAPPMRHAPADPASLR